MCEYYGKLTTVQ